MRGPLAAVGMVFQAPVLLKWRRLLDIVLLPADLAGLARRDHLERARATPPGATLTPWSHGGR